MSIAQPGPASQPPRRPPTAAEEPLIGIHLRTEPGRSYLSGLGALMAAQAVPDQHTGWRLASIVGVYAVVALKIKIRRRQQT
ncbi:hypothetical protein [Streptomyces flavofungini]|uniref:hypothetical protein n=1 Tax=Streptomyces flavofungini TaxID=68200 RepID=UPI0025B0A926|nr:hypothetical protein [Streptomyces flavofungini]WJV51740.1 hypothetical protein QUY26_39620 [Streptomyces flavofungini]